MGTGNGSGIASEKYHVLQELGRGGMGIVYLAEDRQLRRQVALKVLYDYLNRDREFVERFQEEARSVSCLHHPNIVCIHGLDGFGDQIAIDMEYVEGTSLDQLPSAPPHLVAAIARDVLGGLAACHQIGVIHRDIKPSNILLNTRGHAKITDFGLATAYANHMEQSFQTSTSSGFYMGTPRYMPLQAWEGGPPEPYWDLYSFGVVLHELLSGQTAFKAENPIAVMRKQLSEPLAPLQTINGALSGEFSELVDALLDTSRKQSGMSCSDLFELLRKTPEFGELHSSDSVATVPMLPVPRTRKKKPGARRRRTGTLVALPLALIVGFAGLGWYIAWTREAPAPAPPETAAVPAPRPIPRGGTVFYDSRAVTLKGEATWMVETNEAGAPAHITGISERSLWVVDQFDAVGDGSLKVTGYWAGSDFSESGRFACGELEGHLLWGPNPDQPVLTVAFRRDNDLQESPETIVGYRRTDDFDQTDFLTTLEANDQLMTDLYGELLPPGRPWAVALEARLPAQSGARMTVPLIAETMTVDGKPAETTWTQGAFDKTGRIGELAPRLGPEGSMLMARWDDTALYILAHCPTPDLDFELAVAAGVELLPTQSGRFFHRVSARGVVSTEYFQGGTQRPWRARWETKSSVSDTGTCVELAIPLATINENFRPVPGRRWRINARFTRPGGDGPIALWGADDERALEHGDLMIFRPAAE